LQITSDFDGDTYRTVDTVKLKATIYVLHALQKKSNQGNKTSPGDTSLIKARLKTAIELHAESEVEVQQGAQKAAVTFLLTSACLTPTSILRKADLVIGIASIIRSRGLSQAAAAKLIGVAQP
jgi:hypothetical protein